MKIKFRALCLTALVAVLAFASVASATTFVGMNGSTGAVQTLTIDLGDSGTPISTKDTVSYAPNMKHNGVFNTRFFAGNGKIYVVSADTVGTGASEYVYVFTVNDKGKVEYTKDIPAPFMGIGYSGLGYPDGINAAMNAADHPVKALVDFNGTPVFISNTVVAAILNDTTVVSLDLSADVAFVANDKLYLINSRDASFIQEISTITASTKSTDIADTKTNEANTGKSSQFSYKMRGDNIAWKALDNPGAFNSVVTDKNVYVASETGLYKIDVTEVGVMHTPEVKKALSGSYKKVIAKDTGDTLLAVKYDGTKTYLVSISAENESEVELSSSLTTDFGAGTPAACSFDIFYDADDDIIGVVNQGFGLAIYIPDTNTTSRYKLFTVDNTFASAAMVKTASDSSDEDSKGETTTSTVVDASKITDTTEVANLKDATGGDTADFVTTATEATGTTPDTTVTANVRSAAGTGYENAAVAAVKNYTLASDGYILVKAAYDASKVKVFFVPASSSSSTSATVAASTSEGVLLDDKYAKASSTSTYASSTEKLTAGTYTLVTATKTASGEGESGTDTGSTTSSSSGGCDAGFGLWAAAALMAVSTISKRR